MRNNRPKSGRVDVYSELRKNLEKATPKQRRKVRKIIEETEKALDKIEE